MDKELHWQTLICRYPQLTCINDDFHAIAVEIIKTLENGGTLFVAGNGGSSADADHLAGELLKGFCSLRPLAEDLQKCFSAAYGDEGAAMAKAMQRGLKCVSLLSHPGFCSAFANDVDPSLIYAQQLQALGSAGDTVIGFSTSGNAENIRKLFMTGRMLNIKTVLFTGAKSGKARAYADYAIHVPETETYMIQELHLPVYHALALYLEEHFFGGR